MSSRGQDHFNPELAPAVRWINIVVLVVVMGGSLLLLAPEAIVRHWPWPLPPFNARFLGAIYLAEAVSLAILVRRNRWSPVRLAFIIALCFTVPATAGSLIHLDLLSWSPRRAILWFVLYGGYVILPAAVLWHYRHLAPVAATQLPGALRAVATALGAAIAIYAVMLFVAPQWAAAFWPWPVDALHGRIYSGMFMAEGVGLVLAARNGAREDVMLIGAATSAHGAASIAGLYIAAASTGRDVAYDAGVMIWLAAFAMMTATGVALLAAARR